MNLRWIGCKIITLGVILLLLAGCTMQQQEAAPDASLRILFIGNSYTFYNDLPEMFAELVQSSGKEIDIEMAAVAGWTLSDHAASEGTQTMIQSRGWDYVILQEQSVIPSVQEERAETMYPAVRALDDMIRNAGAETVLLMTWGRRDGLPAEGFQDFNAMQAELGAGYTEIGGEVGAIVARVGLAWQNAVTQDANMDLWDIDGSHPSKMGSYLAACVLYAAITQESPEGLAYRAGLLEDAALFLQRIAAETVLGNE
jgi:hypothetical protein